VHVVHPQWLWDCVSQWQRIPEAPYEAMLHAMYPVDAQLPGPSPPGASLALPSADPGDGSSSIGSSLPSPPGPTVRAVAASGSYSAPGSSSSTSSSELEGDEFLGSGGKGVDKNGTEVDWAAVDEEVDAFLNESGDEDVDDYEGASDSSLPSDARWATR